MKEKILELTKNLPDKEFKELINELKKEITINKNKS